MSSWNPKNWTQHPRVIAGLVLLVVTGYWLVACGAKLLPSSPCGRSSIDLLMFAPFCQRAAMIFLHCWPHKLSDQLSIEGQEGQRKQQNTPSNWVAVRQTGTALTKQGVISHFIQLKCFLFRRRSSNVDTFCSETYLD